MSFDRFHKSFWMFFVSTVACCLLTGAATDQFGTYRIPLDGPSGLYGTAGADDAADLTYVTRAIYISSGGNLKVTSPPAPVGDGSAVTFNNLPTGMVLPIRAARVWTTGTTASYVLLY